MIDHPVAQYLHASTEFFRSRLTDAIGQDYVTRHAYFNKEDFVAKHGQAWTPGPRPKGVRMRTPQHCFMNAYNLVTSPTGERLKLRYVEGYASGIIPTHHAWAVTPEGVVVETTWGEGVGKAYFGVVFPMEVVDAAMYCSGHWGVLDDWQHDFPILQQPYDPTDPKAVATRLFTMGYAKEK